MYMHNAPARRPPPRTAGAISEHGQATEPASRSGERMCLFRFPVSQPHDRVRCSDQERAVFAVRHALHSSVQHPWHGIEFRRSGSPSPDSCLQSDPQVPLIVAVQFGNAMAHTAHLRVASDTAIANFAELSIGRVLRANPNRALAIFTESIDGRSSELCILSELAVLPGCQPIP